jgi:glucose-1-phosphate adenylyltransferase
MNSSTGESGSGLSRETFALVLAGGNGTRLGELTRWQCKPAIPFAGQYRNIDFTLSNCVNSGVRRVGVLTQYKAHSLINHIVGGWSFLPRALGEFVEVWPAQQRLHSGWYAGTADAVYQNLDLVLAQRSRYTLVLAGDHIYKMDYRRLLQQHVATGAGVTVACVPVPIETAGSFGVLGVNERHSVQSFIEKPAPATLASTASTVLASMGIYVFTTDYLEQLLTRDAPQADSAHDFGKDILPTAVRENQVSAHMFVDESGQPGYWRDVGTIESYWQTHMELLASNPAIDLYDADWPIRTLSEGLPPAKLAEDCGGRRGFVASSMLSGGTVVGSATVTRSVLSPNVRVGDGTMLDESVVLPNARIGTNCRLRRVIIDAGVEVPDGTIIGWQPSGPVERMSSLPHVTLMTGDATRAKDFRSVA